MKQTATFTKKSAERIGAATVKTEGQPQGARPIGSPGQGDQFPWHLVSFWGFPLDSEGKFHCNAGEINIRQGNIVIDAVDVIVPGAATGTHGPFWIYVQYVVGSGTAIWAATAASSKPVIEGKVFRKWFFKVRKHEGQIHILDYGHFNIPIMPVYATATS